MGEDVLTTWKQLNSFWSEDIQVRFETIVEALRIFYDNPIMGVGYGMYAGFNTSTITVGRTEVILGSAHNGLGSILAESGLVGLVIIVLLLFSIFKNISTRFTIKRTNSLFLGIKVYIIINVLSFFVSNFFFVTTSS